MAPYALSVDVKPAQMVVLGKALIVALGTWLIGSVIVLVDTQP